MLYKSIYELIEKNERFELVRELSRKYDPVKNETFGKTEVTYHINEINGDWRDSYRTYIEAKRAFKQMI